jgi:hypothetical protein
MGAARRPVGHLCIDLNEIVMTGDQQRELLRAVEATVLAYLAKVSEEYKVVTITMAPNNGFIVRQKPRKPRRRRKT